ncbi:hypothetical protein DPMN_109274 [Dreissena polymorpha]|uniref:Uncharacterized protein n=1 Tax=Dreissena polymorpha TaxID=45954 RepID=A0A9D4QLS8_DREPO|nr:hypothetical protein DPMN_109274 [Dreissena polymorpha]
MGTTEVRSPDNSSQSQLAPRQLAPKYGHLASNFLDNSTKSKDNSPQSKDN